MKKNANRLLTEIEELLKLIGFYKPFLASLCVGTSNKLKEKFGFKEIDLLHNTLNLFLSNVPSTNYKIILALTNMLVSLERFAMEEEELSEEEYTNLYIHIIYNNLMTSYMLGVMGLPGEAYNYQVKATNPIMTEDPVSLWSKAIEFKIPGARETVIKLAANLFYLIQHLGHAYEECHQMYLITKRWSIVGASASEEDIEYYCFYATILYLSKDREDPEFNEVLTILENQFKIENERNPLKAIEIAEILASKFGRTMGIVASFWAEQALSFPEINNYPHKKVSMTLTYLLSREYIDYDLVGNSIIEYLDYLKNSIKDKLMIGLQKQRLSQIVLRPILKSLTEKKFDFAFRCAYFWRTYPEQKQLILPKNQILIMVISNISESKISWLIFFNGETKYYEFQTEINLQSFLNVKNQFEGTWTILSGQKSTIERVDTTYIADIKFSNSYEEALTKFLMPKEIIKVLSSYPADTPIKIFELSWMNIPITQLLGKHHQSGMSSLAINSIRPQRKLNKVLLWCDPDSSLFDAHLEREAIEEILSRFSIEFITVAGDDCTKERFEKYYSSNEFDLIWLMCHGKYDYDNPPASGLEVQKNNSINLESLIGYQVEWDQRRLLVLNACESGISSIRYDSMGFVGLGQSLTNSGQVVIGHLWSVDSFVAAVFGTLLIHYLTNDKHPTWENAVNSARNNMAKGKETILSELNGVLKNSQLAQSVFHRNIKWDSIHYWGSATMFD